MDIITKMKYINPILLMEVHMSNLYQYLTENYKENEPFFLSDIQIKGMTGNNIRQQLKKLTDTEKV